MDRVISPPGEAVTKAWQIRPVQTRVFTSNPVDTGATLGIPMRTPVFCIAALLLVACTSHEGEQPESRPEPTPPIVSAPQIALRGAIASVALVQDCPDPPPPSAAAAPVHQSISAGARAKPGPGGPGDTWQQPCTQSSMQLTLSHDAREAQRVVIKAARLTAAATGALLAPIPTRGPTRWDDAGTYSPWDETLPAKTELKASYKLGEPDWSAVTKALGNDDTYAPRYVLEVDIELAGRITTLRSPEFQREFPHVVVT